MYQMPAPGSERSVKRELCFVERELKRMKEAASKKQLCTTLRPSMAPPASPKTCLMCPRTDADLRRCEMGTPI